MSIYLVTGAAGFIGSHLVRALVARGHPVRGIDNFSTGSRANVASLDVEPRFELLEGDINDTAFMRDAMRGVECVLHQAAIPSVPRSIADPWTSHYVNASGTLAVLEAARRAGTVKRFVYASSSSVYGDTPVLPKVETMPTSPQSPYAVSKLAGEHYVMVYHRVFGLPGVALRYFNVFGPRQDPNNPYAAVIAKYVAEICADRSPPCFGDGEQTRDFTYIDNVVQANLLAAAAPNAPGNVFNVACGMGTSLRTVARFINEAMGKHVPLDPRPPRPGDVRHSQADITRAADLLGYLPQVPVREGLRRYVAWYLENEEVRPGEHARLPLASHP